MDNKEIIKLALACVCIAGLSSGIVLAVFYLILRGLQ